MNKENIYYHTSLPKVHGTSCPHSLINVSVSVSVVLSTIDFSSWLPERKQCIYAYERGNTGIIKNTDFKARMSMCIPRDVSKFGYEYTSSLITEICCSFASILVKNTKIWSELKYILGFTAANTKTLQKQK